MINFTPPIKASLFVSLVYITCFQLFQFSGNYAWLYPGNMLFLGCSVLYVLFLNKTSNTRLNMLALTSKGIKLSFVSSILSLAGAMAIFISNYYLFPDTTHSHLLIKNIKQFTLLIFANAFLVNIVCGSLAAFLTAGIMNERNYSGSSRPLPSVRN